MTTLIGTNPDQIPVNSMLGGMAYQDPDSINVKDFNSSGTANIASLVSPAASITTLTNTTANLTNITYTGTLTGGTGVVNIGSNQIYKDTSGNVSLGGTGALKLNEGTTAQRPASPQEGMIRKNSTLGVIEGYSGGGYVSLEAGRLINVRLFTTHSTHSSFTLDTKTKYIVVELIGGGGGAGTKASGPYGVDLQVSIGGSGGNASGVKFLIKENLQSTYYYYIGNGGAAGTGSLSSGNDGSDSFFSTSPTSVAFTNYVKASGGVKGTTVAPVLPPASLYGGQQGGYVVAGSLTSDAVIMEAGGSPGYRITMVSASNAGLVLSGTPCYLLYTHHPLPWAAAQADLISPTVLSFGAGGSGAVGYRNDSGISSYSQSSYAGFQGMLRVYEYS